MANTFLRLGMPGLGHFILGSSTDTSHPKWMELVSVNIPGLWIRINDFKRRNGNGPQEMQIVVDVNDSVASQIMRHINKGTLFPLSQLDVSGLRYFMVDSTITGAVFGLEPTPSLSVDISFERLGFGDPPSLQALLAIAAIANSAGVTTRVIKSRIMG